MPAGGFRPSSKIIEAPAGGGCGAGAGEKIVHPKFDAVRSQHEGGRCCCSLTTAACRPPAGRGTQSSRRIRHNREETAAPESKISVRPEIQMKRSICLRPRPRRLRFARTNLMERSATIYSPAAIFGCRRHGAAARHDHFLQNDQFPLRPFALKIFPNSRPRTFSHITLILDAS